MRQKANCPPFAYSALLTLHIHFGGGEKLCFEAVCFRYVSLSGATPLPPYYSFASSLPPFPPPPSYLPPLPFAFSGSLAFTFDFILSANSRD